MKISNFIQESILAYIDGHTLIIPKNNNFCANSNYQGFKKIQELIYNTLERKEKSLRRSDEYHINELLQSDSKIAKSILCYRADLDNIKFMLKCTSYLEEIDAYEYIGIIDCHLDNLNLKIIKELIDNDVSPVRRYHQFIFDSVDSYNIQFIHPDYIPVNINFNGNDYHSVLRDLMRITSDKFSRQIFELVITYKFPKLFIISNDEGYADIFLKNAEGIYNKEDHLIAVRADSNSILHELTHCLMQQIFQNDCRPYIDKVGREMFNKVKLDVIHNALEYMVANKLCMSDVLEDFVRPTRDSFILLVREAQKLNSQALITDCPYNLKVKSEECIVNSLRNFFQTFDIYTYLDRDLHEDVEFIARFPDLVTNDCYKENIALQLIAHPLMLYWDTIINHSFAEIFSISRLERIEDPNLFNQCMKVGKDNEFFFGTEGQNYPIINITNPFEEKFCLLTEDPLLLEFDDINERATHLGV